MSTLIKVTLNFISPILFSKGTTIVPIARFLTLDFNGPGSIPITDLSLTSTRVPLFHSSHRSIERYHRFEPL